MSLLNINLNEVEEPKPAPAGKYELQITGCQVGETSEKSKHPGTPMYKVSLQFTDLELNAPGFTHYVVLPTEDDEGGFAALNLRRFLEAFHIPFGGEGIDVEQLAMEMSGHTAHIEVQLTEPNENGDVYNKIRLPKLSSRQGTGRPPRT